MTGDAYRSWHSGCGSVTGGAVRRVLPLVASVALAAGFSAAAPSGQETQTFRTGTRTVSVYATVQGSDGRLVPGLEREDFEVLDNGKPQPLAVFSNEPVPIAVAVMLDTSNSVAPLLTVLQGAVHRFIADLRHDDRATIGSFGTEIAIGPRLTADKAELSRVVREEIWAGGGTPLWNALDVAMNALRSEPERRVVLVLTDGINNTRWFRGSPEKTAVAILQRATREEVMVYVVRTPRPMEWSDPKWDFTDPLLTLVRDTGGGSFDVRPKADLGEAFTRVAAELHHQYLLGFLAEKLDGRTHTLQVRVKRDGMRARARRSYLATPE